MARVIEDFAADGLDAERMTARLIRLGEGERHELVAAGETLAYVLGEERVVWLVAGERHVFEGPLTVLVGAATA